MSRITFNVAAKCDKAGRSQNQDNFWVCPDLEHPLSTAGTGNDTDVELSPRGALLVVADGMGGMNSGEVASQYVIDGIKKRFSDIPADVFASDDTIIRFLTQTIAEADNSIKQYAVAHRESEGMGATVALVWMLGEKAYCAWCGDSRIYCYNPQNSLVRLSHDHSFVQRLVDEGKISADEAFDHPDSNIITRSLGDSGEPAKPETRIYPLHRRDVLLLCSDGLCGLINDSQIEGILAENCTSSQDALRALWNAGEKAHWTDNATIEVACVTEGGVTPARNGEGYPAPTPPAQPATPAQGSTARKPGAATDRAGSTPAPGIWQKYKSFFLVGIFMAVAAAAIVWFMLPSSSPQSSGNGTELDDATPLTGSQYIEHLERVHNDATHIDNLLREISSRRSITEDEAMQLQNFIGNAQRIDAIPADVQPTVDQANMINNVDIVCEKARECLAAFNRSQPSAPAPRQRQQVNPARQNNARPSEPASGEEGGDKSKPQGSSLSNPGKHEGEGDGNSSNPSNNPANPGQQPTQPNQPNPNNGGKPNPLTPTFEL